MDSNIFTLKNSFSARKTLSKNKTSGFTIIEVMVGVAILGIATTIALPNLTSFVVSMRVDNEISALQRLILTSRNTAINMGHTVTMCPLKNNVCINNWKREITVFIDTNNNGVYEPGNTPTSDTIIRVKEEVKAKDEITYPNKRLTYTPTGQTVNGTSGIFTHCPYGEPSMARAIEVSTRGRAHASSDKNNDGKDQTRNGSALSC